MVDILRGIKVGLVVLLYLYFLTVLIIFVVCSTMFMIHYSAPQQIISDVYELGFSVLFRDDRNDVRFIVCLLSLLVIHYGLLLAVSIGPLILSLVSPKNQKRHFFSSFN